MEFSVMTYNIASGRYYADDWAITPDGKIPVDLSKCAQVIRELAPDICGINEINHFLPGFPVEMGYGFSPEDQTGYLAEASGFDSHYFGKAIHFEGRGDYGNAVLSRYPILEADVIPIPNPEFYDEDRYYEPRGIARVKLDVAGGLTVLQVHVGLAVTESQNAVVTLCKILDETTGPVILMGDFNMVPNNFLLDRIRQRLTEVVPEGEGYVHSFPSWPRDAQLPPAMRDYPRCKIDYIFVSEHFRAEACRVHQTRASDHMPMIAKLQLK
jgi:endonuclease/exonuclease/phosphatase family metal-dependent hydrolase